MVFIISRVTKTQVPTKAIEAAAAIPRYPTNGTRVNSLEAFRGLASRLRTESLLARAGAGEARQRCTDRSCMGLSRGTVLVATRGGQRPTLRFLSLERRNELRRGVQLEGGRGFQRCYHFRSQSGPGCFHPGQMRIRARRSYCANTVPSYWRSLPRGFRVACVGPRWVETQSARYKRSI